MSTISTQLMTAEELLQLPRGYYRAELVNGVLKTMPLAGFHHGRIAMRLMVPLGRFVWDHDLGEVLRAGFQLTWNPDTVLGPDVAFISKQRLETAGTVEGYWPGPPDLAVEVLKLASGISASDRLKDLADVQELIKIKRLDADFALKLDPYVRAKYLELEEAVRNSESSQEK